MPTLLRIYYEQMDIHDAPKFTVPRGPGVGAPLAQQVLGQHRAHLSAFGASD